MEADQRVENDELGAHGGDGLAQTAPMLLDVEADDRRRDDPQIQLVEAHPVMRTDAAEPFADEVQRIFGGEEQDASGVMIYWHVEKKSVCIYSQLKRCSSSEVAAMIEGVMRHSPR